MYNCYFEGEIKPFDQVKIGVTDLGILRGYALFDFFRTYNGFSFQWDWHWERFRSSSEKLGIPLPMDKAEVRHIVDQLISLSPEKECAIRLTLTGGISTNGLTATKPTFFILSEKISPPSAEEFQNGIKVKTYEYLRDLPEIKSTDYKFFLKIKPELNAHEASDVLFVYNGFVTELSRSNIFIIQAKQLITPDINILKGITRRTVIDLAKSNAFDVIERDITLEELLVADEVFTTSTTKGVLPISQIDNSIIGTGKIGKGTQLLHNQFVEFTLNWKG